MKIEGPAKLVRIYVGESDQWHGRSLTSAIVTRAREQGLAGATVLRGMEGFGANSRVHTARILQLSEDLPVVIEIVDVAERIGDFLPVLDEMVVEGLVVIQDVDVLKYVANPKAAGD
jgi:PII-like signaling protein